MDATLRGMVENFTDKYIEQTTVLNEGIRKAQEIIDEYSVSSNVTNAKDLLMGYHLGIMYEYALMQMPHGGNSSRMWSLPELWSIIHSKINKLSEKIERELNR